MKRLQKPVDIIEGEVWKSVPNLPHYEASSLGRVRKVTLVPLRISKSGYYRVGLIRRDRTLRETLVHRVVAAAFLGVCPKGKVVHHKDHTRLNNRPENLTYVTHRQNIQFAADLGHMSRRWPMAGRAKLTPAKAAHVRELHSRFSQRRLAKMFGVSRSAIQWVLSDTTWKVPNHPGVEEA